MKTAPIIDRAYQAIDRVDLRQRPFWSNIPAALYDICGGPMCGAGAPHPSSLSHPEVAQYLTQLQALMHKSSVAQAAWAEAVATVLEQHRERPGALLPILHGIQHELGYVPPESVEAIARSLNLSRAEVHGVVTFYHEFRSTPPGRHVIKLCRAESCQSVGADALLAHAQTRLGVALHHTTADGHVTLEPIYCLGNCALSPAMMVDDEIHGMVTPSRFDAVLGELGGVA